MFIMVRCTETEPRIPYHNSLSYTSATLPPLLCFPHSTHSVGHYKITHRTLAVVQNVWLFVQLIWGLSVA